VFAEEFIEADGVAALSAYINRTKGTLQAQCLQALRAVLVYVSAMTVLSQEPRIISEIYNLTDPNQEYSLSVLKNALELLLVFVSYLDNGFHLVNKSAREATKMKISGPYENFIQLLRSGDLDVQVHTLAVMNILMAKAPTEMKKKKLLFWWETAGLKDVLKIVNENEYPAIKEQMNIFQKISQIHVPRSWFEAEKYKREYEKMATKYEQTQEKLFGYQRQQAIVKLMKSELMRCRETMEVMSITSGLMPKAYPRSRLDSGPIVDDTADLRDIESGMFVTGIVWLLCF
jgi:hypothetical protein